MEEAKPKSSMQKFRQLNPRYDYYATPDAAAVIERLRKAKPGVCTRELLDMLVVEGGNAWFPDTTGTRK